MTSSAEIRRLAILLQDKSRVRVFSEGILPSAPHETIQQWLTLGMDNDTPSRQLAREVLAADRTYFSPAAAEWPRSRIGAYQDICRSDGTST